jgi:DNA polymerase-3 subunit delta
MKLSFRDIEPFVKKPDPAARVVLVYGPDNGLMKERAKTISQSIVADINDPFNAVTLSADTLIDDPARLSDEASAMSMMGGDRLIRIEDGADKLTPLIKDYLQNPSNSSLVVIEAGELGKNSTLRVLCEKEKNAAAVPCYVEDERDLGRLIRESVQAEGHTIESDAATWLAANISGDRLKARGEIEKLIVYKGTERTPINLEDVRAACGETGALALDDLVYATAGNDAAKALQTYNQLMEEDVNFVMVLRALQNHFRRLHFVRAHIEDGLAQDIALKKLSPPLFFKQEPAFRAQLGRWSLKSLAAVLDRLMNLEAECKKTGAPVETLCAQAVLGISKTRG